MYIFRRLQFINMIQSMYFLLILIFIVYISMYKFGLSVCLSVCLFVSNKRQNGWTDRVQILCVTSRDHKEGL